MKGSYFIIPLSVVIHLVIINLSLYLLTPETYTETLAISVNISWLLIGVGLNFYSIDRKEKFRHKFHKFLRHFFVFVLSYFSVLAFLKVDFNPEKQILVLASLLFLLLFYRLSFFEFRKYYRQGGGNYLKVAILGNDANLIRLENILNDPDYGYRYLGYFADKAEKLATGKHLGKFEDCFDFILNQDVDEIYCSVSRFSKADLLKIRDFSDNHLVKLKLIPDNKGVYSSSMEFEIFENLPFLNLRKSPLDKNYAKYGKRIFDIIFSSLVIIGILSWLIPLLFILNLFESKGPVIFKQLRHGKDKKVFWCYKFRSMAVNTEANSRMCSRNDLRVTKIGKFLRKTSIDELPQFINVFLGEMSVVGPRPHMELHTIEYEHNVNKYLVRHFAKPGITGLAQVRGYRGEIIRKSDIINRTRMDIFYLEKWTALLDLKIIYQTIYNCFYGEEKAY